MRPSRCHGGCQARTGDCGACHLWPDRSDCGDEELRRSRRAASWRRRRQ